MGGTVVANLDVVSLCEDATGWTGAPVPAQHDTSIWDQIQGNRCLQSYSAGAAVRNAAYDFGVGNLKSFAGKILVIWFAISKKAYSTTNPPMKIRLTDGSGYYRDWHIFTKATLPHTGWIPWVIHADFGYDYESNASFNVNQIRYVGWRIEEAVVGKTYIWWDAVRWGTGLTIKGGTKDPYDPATLEVLYQADIDVNNAYGIIDKIGGVYYSYGKITIGSLTADESTYFEDQNQVLIFKSIKGNPTGFYEVKGQNATSGSGTTKIFFGEKSGTAGISGCFIRSPSAMKWKLTMSDTYITEFGFYSCTFVYADTIQGQAYSTVKEFLSSNFIACAEMIPDTGIVNQCIFISSPVRAIRISSINHHVTDCQFINCQTAIHHDVGGSQETPLEYDYDKLIFTGGTYHIENSTSGTNKYINIDRINGSNPDQAKIYNPNGGVTVLLDISVHLYLTGLVSGSEVEILEAGTQNELAHVESSGTTFDYQYYYAEGVYIDIIIHKEDYEWYFIPNYGPLSQNDAIIPISQRKDRVYKNP